MPNYAVAGATIAALALTVLSGCAAPGSSGELRSTYDTLVQLAGSDEIGQVVISDREVTISVLDGVTPTTHSLRGGVGREPDTNRPTSSGVFDYRPAADVPIDGLLDRVDAARPGCVEVDPEGDVTASLTFTVTGAVLETIVCSGDDPGRARIWVDGVEFMADVDEWSSEAAMQNRIDLAVALIGPSQQSISFADRDFVGAGARGTPVTAPGGGACAQGLDWWPIASEPEELYGTCSNRFVVDSRSFDASVLTARAVLDAIGPELAADATNIQLGVASDGGLLAWVFTNRPGMHGPLPVG